MLGTSFVGRLRAAASGSVCQELRNQLFAQNTPSFVQIRTATKRGGGSTKNGRSSAGKRLGVKKYGGEYVLPGNIIVRQRGTKFHPGQHVGIGRDHTLVALQPGYICFYEHEIPYPHQRESKLQPAKAKEISKIGEPDTGVRFTRKPEMAKEFPMVKFPRGLKRYVGIVRHKDEVLPRDEREEGRERWFWQTDGKDEVPWAGGQGQARS